ncbi:protein NLRC5-like [Alosa sapidissima]|uniref:protein NLRC5-like n=1 Tax=Alosa sapidissima TaxID=34773 RepID=UPI001C095D2A|nr:protein NLRC5-like [Alosa sapidissima]
MASTEQSALDFIKKGRALLEKSLQNLSVILNKLLVHKVLDKDQVTYIKSFSETSDGSKYMIDQVICKGEAACYELLTILYSTRFKTFPKSGLHNPDLHHWISCFSFVDDLQTQSEPGKGDGPCLTYQQELKNKAKEILQEKWRHNVNFLKNEAREKTFKYTPLVLDTDSREVFKCKAYKKTRSKKLKTYIPTDQKNLSPEHLLRNNEKKILLVGKPGIGKTTVAQQVLRLWTEQDHGQGSYMFYFDEPLMRIMCHSSAPRTLRSLLFEMYLQPKEGIEEIYKDIVENSENVTIIFDGIMDVIDNSVLKNVLEKELLCDAKILTTCRPEAEDFSILADWPSYRVEVHGFNAASIHAYFEWMLGTKNYAKCHALNNPELFSLCHVPMYAFIVTACMPLSPSDACKRPYTITEMYVQIFHYCLKRTGEQNAQNLNKYIQDNKGKIRFLAKTSYKAMEAKTVKIKNVDGEDEGLQHAFLTSLSSKVSSASYTTFSAFLHNTMQEFWAALFLLMEPGNISDALSQCRTEDGKYLKYIFPFLCGLLSKTVFESISCLVSEEHIQHITSMYFKDIITTFLYTVDQEEAGTDNILFICQCLYEYQSPEACLDFLNRVNNDLDLRYETLDPHQCCAVSYVISQAIKQNVELNLLDCSLSEPGVKMILGCLKNLQRLSMSPKIQHWIWNIALHAERKTDIDNLLRLLGYNMHLAVQDQEDQKLLISDIR